MSIIRKKNSSLMSTTKKIIYLLGCVFLCFTGYHFYEEIKKVSLIKEKFMASQIEKQRNTNENKELTNEDIEYIYNSLETGNIPYKNNILKGSSSQIRIITSANTDCDLVTIVKKNNLIVRNAYIKGGDEYTFNLPNGTYQVFFYGGKGWKPTKIMNNSIEGGFVTNESFSKDYPVTITNQILEYRLILQSNGNFSTKPSSQSEIF